MGLVLFLLLAAGIVAAIVVSGLSARVRQLEARVRVLEAARRAGAPAPGAAPEPPGPALEPEPTPDTDPLRPPAPAARPRVTLYVPPRRPVPPLALDPAALAGAGGPEEPAPAEKPAPGGFGRVEAVLGAAWLNRVGVVVLLLGLGFFLKYAFDNQWVGPTGRVAIGLAAGLAFLVAGERLLRAAYRVPAQGLVALGIGTLYLSIYAAYGFYALVPQAAALALMVLVTMAGVALAVRHDAAPIALLATLGGFLTPGLLRTGEDRAGGLFAYLALLDAGVLASAYWRGWRALHLLSFVLTQAYFWAWYVSWYGPERLGVALAGATAFFLIFALVAPVEAVAGRAPAGWRAAPLLVLAAPTAYFVAARAVLYPAHRSWLGLGCLALSAAYLAAARGASTSARGAPALALPHLAVSLAFLTLAFPVQLTEHGTTIAWSVEGLALLWGGFRLHAPRLRAVGLAVLLLAGLRWLAILEPRTRYDGTLVLAHPALLPTLALVAACALAALLYARREGERSAREAAAWPALALAAIGAGALFLADALRAHAGLARLPAQVGVLTTVVWTGAAVPVLALAPRDRTRIVAHAAWLLLAGIGIAAMADAATWRPAGPVVFNLRFASGLLIVLVYGVFASMADDLPIAAPGHRVRLQAIAAGAAALFLLWNLSAEVFLMPLPGLRGTEADKVRSLGLSVLWTVYAFAALGVGIWRDRPAFRVGAMALFGLTVLKVFVVDLAALDAAYRVLSFLVLGGLLVLASFLYARFRAARPGA
jgi:uncharacterized membrane protein